ncbi:MAG: hypothetical protein OHK0039_06820 [Bacteroidia bacterium]
MKPFLLYTPTILLLLWLGTACRPASRYDRLVARELASGVRADSLFLGIYLGMPSKDFYTHCWELNRQQRIMQGDGNRSVKYEPEGFKAETVMNFYPTFDSVGTILEMPVLFAYKGWSPWNKDLQAPALISEVLRLFERWYGGTFIEIKNREGRVIYVHVKGNRRIIVQVQDSQYVKATFADLSRMPSSATSACPL